MRLYLLFMTGFWLTTYAKPIDPDTRNVLEDRETACIALNDCPGESQPQPSSSSSSSPPPPPASSSVPPTSVAPVAQTSPTGDVSAQGPVRRIFLDTDTCSDTQQKQINQAWSDASLLARAALGGRLDYDYVKPKTEWMGKDWNWGGWWPISSNYRAIIDNNVGREGALYGDSAPNSVYIYLSCPKQHDTCTPGTIAASADSNGWFWTNHYTIFCPIFFNKDSMSVSLGRVKNDVNEQMIMDNYWGNQGYTFFHETYHYKITVSQPRTEDLCYQAAACWEMAADPHRGTWWALKNADSYTLWATAIYVQQYFKTVQPPVPRKYTIALTQNNSTLFQQAANPSNSTPPLTPDDTGSAPPQATEYYKALDSVPEDLFGTTNNVNISSQNVNPRWKEMVGPPLDTSSTTGAPSSTAPSSTAPPPSSSVAPSSSSAPPPSATPNLSSAACQSCEGDLGASNCAAPDLTCLRNQCKNDKNCQTCGLDCDTVG